MQPYQLIHYSLFITYISNTELNIVPKCGINLNQFYNDRSNSRLFDAPEKRYSG